MCLILLVLPAFYAKKSFIYNVIGHRGRLLDRSNTYLSITAWSTYNNKSNLKHNQFNFTLTEPIQNPILSHVSVLNTHIIMFS